MKTLLNITSPEKKNARQMKSEIKVALKITSIKLL